MPTKRCCCGPCFTYEDNFQRPGNNTALLEPDWEPCDDWTDWEITAGGLNSANAGATAVLQKMVGNPYGILTFEIEWEEGKIWQVLVYKGTKVDPCGAENYLVEFEGSSITPEMFVRIKQGSSEIESRVFFSPTEQKRFTICVTAGMIEVKEAGASVLRACVEPSGYWFALRSVTTNTAWKEVLYSDHFLHDRRCPKCQRHCCFPTSDDVVVGFEVNITGIESESCTCASSISDLILTLSQDDDRCECAMIFQVNPDGTPNTIPGPHGCGAAISTPDMALTCLDTSPPGTIQVTFTLRPDDGFGGEAVYQVNFPPGTLPENLSASNVAPSAVGDEQSCRYANSRLFFTPITALGCCQEDAEEVLARLATPERLARKARIEAKNRYHNRMLGSINKYRRKSEGLGDAADRLCNAAAKAGKDQLATTLGKLLKYYACNRRQAVKMMNRLPEHYDKGG